MKKIKDFLKDFISGIIDSPYILNFATYAVGVIDIIIATIITFLSIRPIKANFDFSDFMVKLATNVYNKVFIIIFIILMLLYIIFVLIKYFKGKKSIGINILLIITLLFAIFAGVSIWVSIYYDDIDLATKIGNIIMPENLDSGIKALIFIGYLSLPIILFMVFLGILSKKFDDSYLGNFIICLLVNTIGIGLIILVITIIAAIIINIKAILITIGIGALALVGSYIGFGVLLGGTGGGRSYTPSPKKEVSKTEIKTSGPEVKEFSGDVSFVREYSINYSSDQIYADTYFGHNRVCSAKEFDDGKVIIKKNGQVVKTILRKK
nr:hypothetical protein [Bacilli bacterium]